jgi:ATP-dependent exoDNAse (exonuclease V) alpha subunit
VPPEFKQWTHGYVVTSHKAQGRTCERVVVAAARLDAKSAYVACSRGRELCSVHAPDKAALMTNLPEGNRRAALDVLAADPRTDLSLQLRSTAYREIIADVRRIHAQVNRRTEQARQMNIRYHEERQRVEKAERMSAFRQSFAPSERSCLDFTPVQSPRTGIGT